MNLLTRAVHDRRIFNPADKKDVEDYRYFVVNGKWKNGCPFYLDWPYLTVPDMIKDRISRHALKVL